MSMHTDYDESLALLRLVVNKLLEMYGHTTPIYTISGWEKEQVEPIGWNEFLRQRTVVPGKTGPLIQLTCF